MDSISDGAKRSRPVLWLGISAAAVVLLGIGYGAAVFMKGATSTSPSPVINANISLPAGVIYNDGLGGHSAIAPDGSMVTFSGTDSLHRLSLWVRRMNASEAKQLAGTENAQYPFWSPDGRMIGFFADGKLKTVDANGGPVMTLADAPFGRGGSWSASGEIVFCPTVTDNNLFSVPSTGGSPRQVTRIDSSGTYVPRFPCMLPDGDHFLFTMITLGNNATKSDIHLGSLKEGTSKKLISEGQFAVYSSGTLFFCRQGTIIAQHFDAGRLELSGKPTAIQGNVNMWIPRGKADFSVSDNGLLVFSVGSSARSSELFWYDRQATPVPIGSFDPFFSIRLSHDNTKLAYDQVDAKGERPTVWISDLKSTVRTRLTFRELGGSKPVWSHDDSRIFFSSDIKGKKSNILVKRSDGSGEETMFVSDENGNIGYVCQDVSPDGRYLLVSVGNESGSELGVVDLSDTVKQRTVQRLGIKGASACFSPDGKWIAVDNKEGALTKVYVASFRGVEGMWLLPSDGASSPFWVKNRIIYYSTSNDSYEECAITFTGGSPVFGQPTPLFTNGRSQNAYLYGVAKDGERFLGLRPANAGAGSTISLIVNWKGLVATEQ